MKARISRLLSIALLAIIVLMAAFLLYASRRHEAVLFYYGGAVESPDETALAIMNPFRDKASEKTAERLIADLRTSNCQTIVKEFSDDPRICPVLQTSHHARLVWREDGDSSRMLVYDIPEKRARLWISFSREEGGLGVRSISVVR